MHPCRQGVGSDAAGGYQCLPRAPLLCLPAPPHSPGLFCPSAPSQGVFYCVHAGHGVVPPNVATPQQIAGVAVQGAVGRRVCVEGLAGGEKARQGKEDGGEKPETGRTRPLCCILMEKIQPAQPSTTRPQGCNPQLPPTHVPAPIHPTGNHPPDMSATMAWHTECRVQAGLHAFFRMSRQISPVCRGGRQESRGAHSQAGLQA